MTIFKFKKKVIPFRITKKFIIEIDPIYRQGRGVLNTPHKYLYF